MTGSGNEERVEIVLLDQAVEVDIGEGLTGVGTPVSKEPL